MKRTAVMMGGALSAPAILGVLEGCTPPLEPTWNPSFFTKEQAVTVMELAETVIPKTDTPGAKDIGVPQFIETMVSEVFSQKDRLKFMNGLTEFDQECDEKMGDVFVDLEQNKRTSFAMQKNRELKKYKGSLYNIPERPFFWAFKELVLLGYFTSQVGATEVLQHTLVPTDFKGCISLPEAGGKTWAM